MTVKLIYLEVPYLLIYWNKSSFWRITRKLTFSFWSHTLVMTLNDYFEDFLIILLPPISPISNPFLQTTFKILFLEHFFSYNIILFRNL